MELKPCPFCGSSKIDMGIIAKCSDCLAYGPYVGGHLGNLKAWNTRSVNWISVKDRLPPRNERVLVWLWEKGKVDIDVIQKQGPSDGGGLQFVKNYLHNVTDWKPLPNPPEE